MDKIGITLDRLSPIAYTDRTRSGVGAVEVTKQFGTFLNESMAALNEQQAEVERLNGQFIVGELADVHQLRIASEKASLGLELTVQVRNKMIEAYQEIMRIQM